MKIAILCVLVSFFVFSPKSQAAEKEWTLLVYLNGNNSLDQFGPFNINSMEKVGSTDKINVVVQWASLKDNGNAKRLFIKQDNDPNNVTSPVVQSLGVVDMGDYKNLVEFIRWGVQNYPAKHYFIDIWDHGGGWHISSKSKIPEDATRPMDISWDDISHNFMTIPQLGLALKEAAKIIGHKVDIYGSDACLMAMPEVSTEMADSVEVYAGSEETEPAQGWPYEVLLQEWNSAQDSSARNVAKILTNAYVKSYEPGGMNDKSEVTFSSFDLSKTQDLHRAIIELGATLSSLPKDAREQVVAAIGKTQNFLYYDFGDLGDFIKNLEAAQIPGLRALPLATVKSALNQFVIANSTTAQYSRALGASIWLPSTNDVINNYWGKYTVLQFQQMTHWGDALKALYK